jgi:Domain of unknown function (DUF4271)
MLQVILFSLAMYLSPGNLCIAQNTTINEKDLSSTWKVFNSNTRTFHEFGKARRSRSVRFSLVLHDDFDGWLEIDAPKETSVIINGNYFGSLETKLAIDLDSLMEVSQLNVFDFNIYRLAGLNHINLSTILFERVPTQTISAKRSTKEDFMDYYVIASLILLLFMGFLSRKFPRDTLDYFSFQRSISLKNREETLISSRPFNRTNILFIILDSFLIGFLITALVHLAEGHVYFPLINRHMDFSALILGWIFCSVLVFFSIVIKYIGIAVFVNLFRLNEFRYIQHFNSLRFSIGAFLLIYLLTTITFLTFRMEGMEAYFVFTRILAILLFMRIIIMFFKLRDFASFRNFHLFSYLCGTEIIPFIILYKLVLG